MNWWSQSTIVHWVIMTCEVEYVKRKTSNQAKIEQCACRSHESENNTDYDMCIHVLHHPTRMWIVLVKWNREMGWHWKRNSDDLMACFELWILYVGVFCFCSQCPYRSELVSLSFVLASNPLQCHHALVHPISSWKWCLPFSAIFLDDRYFNGLFAKVGQKVPRSPQKVAFYKHFHSCMANGRLRQASVSDITGGRILTYFMTIRRHWIHWIIPRFLPWIIHCWSRKKKKIYSLTIYSVL